MCSRLHRSGVVSCGQNHSRHPVHDPLVVGGRPIRIDLGQLCCQENSVHHLMPSYLLGLEDRSGPGQAQVGQIGDDA